jgi:hypothetical protein
MQSLDDDHPLALLALEQSPLRRTLHARLEERTGRITFPNRGNRCACLALRVHHHKHVFARFHKTRSIRLWSKRSKPLLSQISDATM